MGNAEWVYLDTYAAAELMVVKPLLDEANVKYLEKTSQEGNLLEIYTSSSGSIGVDIWVALEDEEKAKKLLQEVE